MKESSRSLSGRLVPATTDARSDVKVDVSVDTRPVIITHEGTASFVNSKVVAQFIVVQFEKFLTGETVIGWNAEATLKEKEAIL